MKRAIRSNTYCTGCIGDVPEEKYAKWSPVEKKIVAKATVSRHPECYMDAATAALELVGFSFTPEFEEAYNLTIENNVFNGRPFRD